jgi:MFS family permease
VNAYNLSFACFLLTGAALGDRFGRKRMFALGITVFTVASAAAALSPSVGALIAARALQGAGAAIIMPLTLTLISAAFPVEKRGMAIGLWGGIAGLAIAAGPVVGGAVAGGINWHWIFWLNIPVGAALIPLAIRSCHCAGECASSGSHDGIRVSASRLTAGKS